MEKNEALFGNIFKNTSLLEKVSKIFFRIKIYLETLNILTSFFMFQIFFKITFIYSNLYNFNPYPELYYYYYFIKQFKKKKVKIIKVCEERIK